MLLPEVTANRKASKPQPLRSVPRGDSGIWLALLALLTAVAAVLRFLFLVRKPFWFDECFSVEVARLRWFDFVRLLWWREANMSLYYLMLRAWLHFGQGPFFIRSLSVAIALATLPAIYWLACWLFDRRVAIIALALLSCNAYHIRYAQEARSYALFVLLATLSSGFFLAVLRDPSRHNRFWYCLTSILAIYSHLFAVLLIVAHFFSAQLWRSRKPRLTRAWIAVGVAALPLLIFVAKTGAGPIRWIPRPNLHQLVEYCEHLAGNDGMVLVLLYGLACLIALWSQGRRLFALSADYEIWRCQFLLIWLLFPVILIVALSFTRPLFLPRYFIFCLPALVILAAAGLARLKAWQLAFGLAAMLAFSLQGTFSYYDHDFDLGRDAAGAATNYILDQAQPGDAILFHIASARIPYEFYSSLREQGLSAGKTAIVEPTVVYPRHGDHLDYRDFTGKPSADLVQSLGAHYQRIWVVLMDNRTPTEVDATTMMLNQTLAAEYPQMERSEFPQVEVRLYRKH